MDRTQAWLRVVRVAWAVSKIFPRYLWLAARERVGQPAPQAGWDRVHGAAARELRDVALALAGAFVKLAQIIGARADVFPKPFIDELSQFHDAVPPRPWAALRPIVESDLGAEIEAVFAHVEPQALAAASLAQVHRARLLDGREVVIKIQYPEVPRLFPLDLGMAGRVARLVGIVQSQLDFRSLADEILRFIELEIDFVQEAEATDRMRERLASVPGVVVPRIERKHCGTRVLVLEYLDGIPVTRTAALEAAGHRRVDVARIIGRLYGRMIFEDGHFHGDPHPGNLLVLPDGRIGLLDFGLCKALPPGFAGRVAGLMIASMVGDSQAALRDAEALGFDIERLEAEHLRGLLLGMIGDRAGDEGPLEILAQSRIRKIPEDFALMLRTLILLNGLAERLVPGRRVLQGELIQSLARGVAAA